MLIKNQRIYFARANVDKVGSFCKTYYSVENNVIL